MQADRDPSDASSSRAVRWLRLSIAAATVVPAVLLIAAGLYTRQATLADAKIRADHAVATLAEHALKVFETNRLVLRQVDERVDGLDWDQIRGAPWLPGYLARTVQDAPHIGALWLIGPDGHIMASSRPELIDDRSRADRDYFAAVQNGAQIFISRRYLGRLLRTPVFNVAWRRSTPDGRFDGLALASIYPSYFIEYWRVVAPPEAHLIALYRADGAVLARSQNSDVEPDAATEARLSASFRSAPNGIWTGPSLVDGVDRIRARRTLPGIGVVLTYGLNVDDVLADWRRAFLAYCLVAALASTALTSSSLFALRWVRREREAARRQAEMEAALQSQRAAEAVLRESEAHLTTLADAMPQLVWSAAPDGGRDYSNARCYEFTGIPPEHFTGDTWLRIIHPEDQTRAAERWQRSLQTGEPYENETRVRRHDGVYRWMLARATPMRDAATGAIVRWFGSSTDITDIVEAREMLARSRDQLESLVQERTQALRESERRLAHAERLQALGQLAGGIAHDFNNVLQAVHGGATLIEQRVSESAGTLRFTKMIKSAAERGTAITSRLLAFARRGELRAEAVDPAALLQGLRDIFAHTLGAAVEVHVSVEPDVPFLLADKGQLETVLVNLATNARDAMPDGGMLSLTATTETVEQLGHPAGLVPGRYVRLSVSDTGTGMDAATLDRVTEPFFTTKGVGKGTGLGLSMAKGFAEQSDGGLRIESAPGQGTTATLWLPFANLGADATQATHGITGGNHAGSARRVLVVDDEPLVRETLAFQLEEAGYDVRVAESGLEALVLLDADAVDLLLTDLSMPGMGGIALIREARTQRPGLPAILLTGYPGDRAIPVAGDAFDGAFSLLRKPVSVRQLAGQIEALLAVADAPA